MKKILLSLCFCSLSMPGSASLQKEWQETKEKIEQLEQVIARKEKHLNEVMESGSQAATACMRNAPTAEKKSMDEGLSRVRQGMIQALFTENNIDIDAFFKEQFFQGRLNYSCVLDQAKYSDVRMVIQYYFLKLHYVEYETYVKRLIKIKNELDKSNLSTQS